MRILLIEDDQEICQAIRVQLVKEGYMTDVCHDGDEALYYALQESYDVIVLDRMLPGTDGLSILHLMRKNQIHTPVIMATAMNSIADRIHGLDGGADDYIVKPYDIQELTARIRALTRRPAAIENTEQLQFADLKLDPGERDLFCKKSSVHLSKRECILAEYFIKNPDKTLSRELIFAHVWGPDAEVEDGNLDNYIHFFRKRLKLLNSCTELKTVHGSGYRLQKAH